MDTKMILGLSTSSFTLLHVLISLVGILAGFVTIGAMLFGRWLRDWNALFLVTTIATSVTGFFFHSASFGPPHVIGVISLVVLSVALSAQYIGHLQGRWRWIYVFGAVVALYLNSFVAVVQAFQKVSFLAALAPTQSEPPFLAAQVVLMAVFIVLGFFGVKRFHPPSLAKNLKAALVAGDGR
jgi:uncharacterized membrane protein SirB2